MSVWLSAAADEIAWMVLAFLAGVVFAAWRQLTIEENELRMRWEEATWRSWPRG